MSFEADALADRRRLRRKLSLWRTLAFLIAIVAVLGAYGLATADRGLLPTDHVARVEISGVILDDRRQRQLLKDLKENERVKGVILAIDSPGGTTTGAEALYLSIRDLAEEKPVVATLGTLAASGGYIAAIGADHIIARSNTLAGSIGVIFQWPDATALLDKVGVNFNQIKSSPIKAEPNPVVVTPPEARRMLEATVLDSYNWFIDLVVERRGLTEVEADRVGDASVFTGRIAKDVKLVDAIGGEEEAQAWLASEHELSEDLDVRTYEPARENSPFGQSGTFVSLVAGALGLQPLANAFSDPIQRLDGLISVWHPETNR